MNFKFIHQLNYEQLKNLYKLVNEKDDMKLLGNGKIWDKTKFIQIYKYDHDDYINNFKNSSYLFQVLTNNNDIIGLSYIHPGFGIYKNDNQIGIIVNKKYKNKGFGKKIIKKMIKLNKKYFKNKNLYSFVNINNIKSNLLFKNYNLKNKIKFFDKYYNIYLLFKK